MFWKFITLVLLIGFAGWRFRQWLRIRRLHAAGEPVPESRGVRPITILAAVLLAGYGGYLAWVLILQAFATFGG